MLRADFVGYIRGCVAYAITCATHVQGWRYGTSKGTSPLKIVYDQGGHDSTPVPHIPSVGARVKLSFLFIFMPPSISKFSLGI
jgi:hypothetical protein